MPAAKTKTTKKEKDAFDTLKDVIWPHNFKDLALKADVCQATLYNWCEGKTQHPRFTTLVKVAKAVGYKLVLVSKGKPSLTIVK